VLLFPLNGSEARPIMAPPFLVAWFVFPIVCTFADGPDIAACISLSVGSRAANGSVVVSIDPPAAACCMMFWKMIRGHSCKGDFPFVVTM